MKNKFETQIDQEASAADLENLDSQVENFTVPEEFMAAAQKYTDEVASERDLEKWNGITADWQILADSSPLYRIALKFVEAKKMADGTQKKAVIARARELIKKYIESVEKGPKLINGRDWSDSL